jgi:serine/threonine-protein kinase RsbW
LNVEIFEKRRFNARRAEFAAVRTFVEVACGALATPAVQRVVLIAEELFSNTIEHGYCGDCDHPVWLTVAPVAHGCTLVYQDAAPAHDPFSHNTTPALPADPRSLPVGGLGVFLIGQFCTVKRYERRAEHNVIELFVPLGKAPRGAAAL